MFANTPTIDWPATKDFVTAACAIAAVIIAWIGLTTWRRQLRGSARYEAAARALRAAYELEYAFMVAREPSLQLVKTDVAEKGEIGAEVVAYEQRITALFEKVAALRATKFEVRARFGSDVLKPFDELDELARTLRAEVWLHLWMRGAFAGPGSTIDRSPERRAATDKVIYRLGPEDEFSKRVSSAVGNMEKHLRAYVGT